jgi:thiamine kinase-like enzyme
VDAAAIVARVWPGGVDAVEPLGGGITNVNLKVTVGGEAFVVRVPGSGTELLGADRAAEHDAALVAAEVGVGAEVVAFLADAGSLVTRFVPGRSVPPAEMRRPEQLARAAEALRRFHGARPILGRFDSHRLVERYRVAAEANGVRLPSAFAHASELSAAIERARGRRPLAPCHCDLLNANLIDDGKRIVIVDWEYAGMGDVFFDLANFSVNHELDAGCDEALLRAYFGAVRDSDRAHLVLMKVMSDFREAMWSIVQQGVSQLDFDFVAYADEHFDRLARTAGSDAFRRALSESGAGER